MTPDFKIQIIKLENGLQGNYSEWFRKNNVATI